MLSLHELHQSLNANFVEVNGCEAVGDYSDWLAEYAALRETAGVLDLSFRSRICLVGADRVRFLHGQVTNDVKRLRPGNGCYAALVTAKGKMQSDLNIYALPDELLLDFEPGLSETVSERLRKYVVADDVEIVDVTRQYGLFSVQGPRSEVVLRRLSLFKEIPLQPFEFVTHSDGTIGEVYLMNQPRMGSSGFDVFAPLASLGAIADKLIAAARDEGGRACGWRALETARIEAGLPRFGADMDERNIPIECGIESRALSYQKGCYIGQEVLNRIHTLGHVNRELRGLKFPENPDSLPRPGDKLFHSEKEVGYITSAVKSPALRANIALGYVRREVNHPGTQLHVRNDGKGENLAAEVTELPFK